MRRTATVAATESGDDRVLPAGFQLGGPLVLAPLATAIDNRTDEGGCRTHVVDVPVTPAVAVLVASQSRVEPTRAEGTADVEIVALIQRYPQSLADCDTSGPRTTQHQDVGAGRGSQVDSIGDAKVLHQGRA
jgi:hypothetical protein